MNTTGIQNYLSNVFRPIYTYDTTTTNFVPKLTMSNIENYTGNTISVFTAAVGDSNSNVYVGSNAGNPYDITRNVFNVTALGYGAASNISNDSNSVYIGWYAGSGTEGSKDTISIGKNSGGNGSNNIFIGSESGAVGNNNIVMGHFIELGSVSNQIRIGYSNQIPIAADVNRKWVGLGGVLSPSYTYTNLDVSGNAVFVGNVGINKDSGTSVIPGNRTLDVNGNFRASDSSTNILDFSNGVTRSTKGFVSESSSAILPGDGIPSQVFLGTLQPGLIALYATSEGTATHYRSELIFVRSTTQAPILMTSNVGTSAITFDYSTLPNIYLVYGVSGGDLKRIYWGVTRFPMI